jgi:hypothetical protein
MSIFVNWRLHALVAISIFAGTSCGEAGRESAHACHEMGELGDEYARFLQFTTNNKTQTRTSPIPGMPRGNPDACSSIGRLSDEYIRLLQVTTTNKNLSRQEFGLQLMGLSGQLDHAQTNCAAWIRNNALPGSKYPVMDNLAVKLANLQYQLRAAESDCVASIKNVASFEANPPTGRVSKKKRSGDWHLQDGELVCDGYLARSADEDFCADEVPEDWVPRKFNGQVYYVQPMGNTEPLKAGS